ncbi:MAG: ribose transport system substrate-binding protein [Methyloprofundus sp.]|nr:MAG: ribose transport system substrate-binding protein [Methyloprofundus sp.]
MNFFALFRHTIISLLLFTSFSSIHAIEKQPSNLSLQIAVLYWSMDIPGQVAMRQGIEHAANVINEKAKKDNLTTIQLHPFVAGNGEAGIEKQIQQLDKIVAEQQMDLIIVQPTDNAALAKGLIKANQKNIPVVAYDQYISGGKLASYITSDNYQAGYLDGEYIASKFDNYYSIKLILVEYPYVSSTVERVDGFIDALADTQQNYTIINSYQAVTPESGSKAATQILHDFPKKHSIDVIFTVNDGGGLNVVKGLSNAGRDEIMVASIDGDPLSLKNITENRLTVINSAQFCMPLGEETLYTAYDILNGKKVAAYKLIPVFPVTQETIANYPSWNGPIPQNFTKQWPSKKPLWSGQVHSPNNKTSKKMLLSL